MDFLKKIQRLDLKKRLIIFWTLVIILGASFFFLWLKVTLRKFEGIRDSGALLQIQRPEIDIPRMEMPDFTIPTIPTIIPQDLLNLPGFIKSNGY